MSGNSIWDLPMVLVSGVGLLALSSGAIQLNENISDWVKIWEGIVHPIWALILYPIEKSLDVSVPDFIKNYITLGIIVTGMFHRSFGVTRRSDKSVIGPNYKYIMIISVLLWPLILVSFSAISGIKYFKGDVFLNDHLGPQSKLTTGNISVFWQTGVVFFVLLALNYALLFKDGAFRF